MKESVHAEQFLYVKHALQYMNGHAALVKEEKSFKGFSIFSSGGHFIQQSGIV